MALREEINSEYPMSLNREALISIIKTSSMLLRLSDRFFAQFGTTDIQFNILMLLKNISSEGLSQQELSEQMVVTKSNIVGLIDRIVGSIENGANLGRGGGAVRQTPP